MGGRNSIALVTGASSGFGQAIACRLVKEGYRVIAAARRKERLDALAKQLGENLFPYSLDVTDMAAIRELPKNLPSNWQAIDILINNAGLALGTAPIPEISLEDWEQMVRTNVLGMIELTQTLIGGMIERGCGHVISLGSTAGTYPYKGGNVYGATKAFVKQFMLNLKTDLLGTPIRVTNIEPGLCGGTEFSEIRTRDKKKAKAVYEGTQPLTAEDIAETVSWVLGLPAHVNINRIEMMPVCQASGGLAVSRNTKHQD